MKEKHKLLIVDDFQLSALGTKALLADYSQNFEIFTAFSVDDSIDILDDNSIDIILCDIFMPEKDGFYLLNFVKKHYAVSKFMFLSISKDKYFIYKSFSMGADGYQFKDVAREDLINSLECLLNGQRYFNHQIFDIIYDDISSFADDIIYKRKGISVGNLEYTDSYDEQDNKQRYRINCIEELKSLLTKREMEIFELIGRGYSTEKMASMLSISKFTVSTHRKNLYIKLGFETLTRMKQFAAEILK